MQATEGDRLTTVSGITPNVFGVIGFVVGVVLVAIGYFGFTDNNLTNKLIQQSKIPEVAMKSIVDPIAEGPVVASVPKHPLPNMNPSLVLGENESILNLHVPLSSTIGSSDGQLKSHLKQLVSSDNTMTLLIQKNMIRRFVIAVDNVSKGDITQRTIPLRAPETEFIATKIKGGLLLTEKNYSRYTQYIDMLVGLDERQLAKLYTYYYPLMQLAYQELGYPRQHFNDRFVEAVDQLVRTPRIEGDIELKKTVSLFQYKDKLIEELPLAQKQLIRLGPDNMVKVKSFLCNLRLLLTTSEPPVECLVSS